MKLRFVTCSDAVSAGIRAGEYGYWASHTEAVMPDGTLLGAHYDGGVQARKPGYDAAIMVRELIVALTSDESGDYSAYLAEGAAKTKKLMLQVIN